MEGFSGRAVPGRPVKGDRVPGDGKGEPSPVTAGTLISLLPGGPTEPAQQASAAGLVWNEALDGAGQAGVQVPDLPLLPGEKRCPVQLNGPAPAEAPECVAQKGGLPGEPGAEGREG